MNTTEVAEAIAYLRTLWPKWEPTPNQTAVWERFLLAIETPTQAEAAIDRAYAVKGRFTNPQISSVSEALAGQPRTRQGREENAAVVETMVWIIDRANPVYPIQMVFRPGTEIWPDAVLKHAQERAAARNRLYGGDWVVVTDCKMMADVLCAVSPEAAARREKIRAALANSPAEVREEPPACDPGSVYVSKLNCSGVAPQGDKQA